MLQCLTLNLPLEEAERLSQQLEEFCLSVSFFETKSSTKDWRLEAIIDENIPKELFLKLLNDFKYEIIALPEKNWLAENRKTFSPLIIGCFFIYNLNSNSNIIPPSDKINLKIEASTAFGTGHHESTKGCLLALDSLKKKNWDFKHCLDLGCGTAVLALAATSLFSLKAMAVDNDPEAVERACFNVQANDFENSINIFLSEGLTHPYIKQNSFDLVVANILAGPLIDLSSNISKVLKKGGVLILSGLLQIQSSDVEKAYKKYDFKITERINQGEWATVVMEKS